MTISNLWTVAVLATSIITQPLVAQQLTAEQLGKQVSIRRERVDLLKDEIKRFDARIESRLDAIIETLVSIADSKDSRTKVARMKEDTGKGLINSIKYYDQKRAALKEEMRNPKLRLTDEEKQKIIAAFDQRIEKRTNQILELHKSMPSHEEHQRYRTEVAGWDDLSYKRNEAYQQDRRMTSHSNTQRDAIIKELDRSIGRLDRQNRSLQTQLASTTDPEARKMLTDEIDGNAALISQRRQQRLATLTPSSTASRPVSQKEATDLDKALRSAIEDLREDFTMIFQRYNTLFGELSSLHASEEALAKVGGR